ncbi:MAG: hypothetical protein ABSC42_15590 [Tepidisphaeraceae bacterium]
MRWLAGIFLLVLAVPLIARAQTAPAGPTPSTEPSIPKTDLLGPKFTSHVHGIEFRPPLNCTRIDKNEPDSIVEFDRDDYNWQLKVWSVRLERSLALSMHKDQFGTEQDGVMEITLANIKRQSPDAEVLRDEVINVGRLRVGIIAVRYETAAHDRRFTQQAIVEAPDADDRLYYFLDLTGPGKPQLEANDVVNPAEKLAYDTFGQVVDSIVLLDRTNLVDFQRQSLYGTMGLFVLWNADNSAMVRSALVSEQYQRIIKDGQDVGYQHIVEEFEPNTKSPESSILKIGVRSHVLPARSQQQPGQALGSPGQTLCWDTETWMFSSADRKHEHWKTAARCTDDRGRLIDSFSQVGISDEQTKAFAIEPRQNPDGSLLPQEGENNSLRGGPLGQGNVDIASRRTLEVNTTHQTIQLNPFHLDVPVFYVPQAFSYLLPEILPLKPKSYMFATFVPNTPDSSPAALGNVMARYVEVLPIRHVKFRGQEFDAVPITDKITLDGSVTTDYLGIDGKFLGSTSTVPAGDQTTTLEIVPTDVQTLGHIWNRPDLSAPNEPPPDTDNPLPHSPP